MIKGTSLRYIIVGYGNIGHKRQMFLGKKCVATVDPDPKQKADYTNSAEVPLNFFDIAVLTVPQQVKYELTKYFLSKGKNVLVEKPLIITSKQGEKLSDLSIRNNCIWYTSYNHRFEPNIQKIQKLLKNSAIGNFYHAKLTYSFGNIQERIGTWRQTPYGVLEEIAPHLIDFAIAFFGYKGQDFYPLISRKVESNIFDHWVFTTYDKKIIFETSSVTWKYVFSIDIYGSKGSLHMNSLRKWGGSDLIIRKRILPSGAPKERKIIDKGPDLTWKKDFQNFESTLKHSSNSLKKDLEISLALAKLATATKPSRISNQLKLYKEIINEKRI